MPRLRALRASVCIRHAAEAGHLVERLSELWKEANLNENRGLLLTMLDAVYVEARESHSIVMVRPKPPFRPVFEAATAREGSGVVLIKHEPQGNPPGAHDDPCSWWRRGGVEPPVQKTPQRNMLQA